MTAFRRAVLRGGGVDLVFTTREDTTAPEEFWLKDLKGWFGGVGVHADDTQRTLGHGLFAASALRTGRALTLTGFMLFSTDEDRLLADRFLSGLLWDGEFGELEVTTGDLTLSTRVRLDGEVSHEYHGDHGVDLQVPLLAPDPFLYGEEQVARIYPAGAGTGLVWPLFSGPSEDGESLVSAGGLSYGARTLDTLAVVHNRGNAESHPRIRVVGEFPSGFTLTADTGETITYPVPVYQQAPVTVDYGTGAIMQNGVDQSWRATRRDWLAIPPGGTRSWRVRGLAPSDGWAEIHHRDTYI